MYKNKIRVRTTQRQERKKFDERVNTDVHTYTTLNNRDWGGGDKLNTVPHERGKGKNKIKKGWRVEELLRHHSDGILSVLYTS